MTRAEAIKALKEAQLTISKVREHAPALGVQFPPDGNMSKAWHYLDDAIWLIRTAKE